MRRASRKDRNHDELVRHAEALGMSVLELYQLPGALDLLVGYCGRDCLCEVKDGTRPPSDRKLTPAERDLCQRWKGRAPAIWLTKADVERTRRELLAEACERRQPPNGAPGPARSADQARKCP